MPGITFIVADSKLKLVVPSSPTMMIIRSGGCLAACACQSRRASPSCGDVHTPGSGRTNEQIFFARPGRKRHSDAEGEHASRHAVDVDDDLIQQRRNCAQ